jgi:hypothetical protein
MYLKMEQEDEVMAKALVKRWRKDHKFKFFVASKRGCNARGIGANRSVILANYGKGWFQQQKVWGENNEQRAKEIVETANKHISEEKNFLNTQ